MSTGCQKDRKTDRQTSRQIERQTDRRQKDFTAQLSKQKLFRMSTGCQKDRKTDRQKYESWWTAKEPALVFNTKHFY